MIRVVIVDDNTDLREYLVELMDDEPSITVAGQASSGMEAVRLVGELLPDVVLMDIQMEERTSGIAAIQTIHRLHPQIKCIVLTIHENDEYLFHAYLAGASDYIVKTAPPESILRAILAVMDNDYLLRPDDAKKIIAEYQRVQTNQDKMRDALQVMLKISVTEYEILRLIYHGYTYRQIAQMRYVEETTVRSQANHILKKFEKKRMKDVIQMLQGLHIFDEKQE